MLRERRESFLGLTTGFDALRECCPTGEPFREFELESKPPNGCRGREEAKTGLGFVLSCIGEDSKICSSDKGVGFDV